MTGMESPQRPRIVSWWDLAALAGFLGLAGFYARILPSLPDPVPTHFNALGQANGWTPKAGLALVVFLPPAILWGILFLIGLVAAMLPPGPRSLGAAPVLPLRGLLGLGMCLLMGGCLLVHTSPAFCCPSLVTEALAAQIERATGVPMVSLTYDGTGACPNDLVIPYLKLPRKRRASVPARP